MLYVFIIDKIIDIDNHTGEPYFRWGQTMALFKKRTLLLINNLKHFFDINY